MMNETAPTDSLVTQVSARDDDIGENSRLASFSVLTSCVSTPPPPRPGSDRASAFNCSYLAWLPADLCQDDTAECDTAPCLNNNTCVEILGSCSCRAGSLTAI